MIRLTLYSRVDCPLCAEMRQVVELIGREVPLALDVVDVDTDAALVAAYGDEVPVLCVEGRKAFAGRVQAPALRARLAAERH
jgi:hypothetical protein